MSTSPTPAASSPAPSPFERWGDGLTDWCPYVTLVASSVLSLAWSTEQGNDRLVTAGLVVLAALWVYFGYTRAPKPRKAHQGRMIPYFIGLLVIASALTTREYIFFLFLITGFFHASVLRPWPLAFAGVFATSVLGQHGHRRVPHHHPVVDDLHRDHRHPDARHREWRVPRREGGRTERAATSHRGPARGGTRGERRPPRPVADPGPRGRRARRTRPHGARDPRHDRPGTDRHRHPAGGRRAGPRPARGLATARPQRDRASPREPHRGAPVGRGLAARASRERPVARRARRGRPPMVGADTGSRSRWSRPATSSRSTPRSR